MTVPKNGRRDAPFVNIYAPSGVGKTVETGRTLSGGTILAAPGATASIATVWNILPNVEQIDTIEEATKYILAEGKKPENKRTGGIGVDDFSAMAENTFVKLERKHKNFSLWTALRETVFEFREAARYAGIALVVNSWEQAPVTKMQNNMPKKIMGGPKLPSDLPEQLPAMADVNLRGRKVPAGTFGPRVRVYDGTDPNYVQKDRGNIATGNIVPMNLGEILRAGGWPLPPRHPEIRWMDDAIVLIARAADQAGAEREMEVLQEAYVLLVHSGRDAKHAQWCVQDAWDRITLDRLQRARLSNFLGLV